MKSWRPASIRALIPITLVFGIFIPLAGCGKLFGQKQEDPQGEADEASVAFGPCWPTHGSDVTSVSGNRAGHVLYISEDPPTGYTATWNSDWLGVNAVDLTTDPPRTRFIAHTWETGQSVPLAASPEPGKSAGEGPEIVEQPSAVQISANAERFVLATVQEGSSGGYRYIYHGQVPPEGNHSLTPDEGLSRIPVNDPASNQFVRVFELSPDGSKVAAIVGYEGELRVFDIATESPVIYDLVDGDVKVSNEIPAAGTERTPAYATGGVTYMKWSPDGSRLAISRAEPGGKGSLGILDSASGEFTHVRSFQNSTAPHATWSDDGTSLTVMVTPVNSAGDFGNTQFLRLPAEANASETSAGEILRPMGYGTDPALLEAVNADTYLFVWEGGLWRLTAPGGDLASAEASRVTTEDQLVPYEQPSSVPDRDEAVFRVMTKGNASMVGIRTDLSEDVCPAGEETQSQE